MTSSGYNAATTEQLRASDESISQRSDPRRPGEPSDWLAQGQVDQWESDWDN